METTSSEYKAKSGSNFPTLQWLSRLREHYSQCFVFHDYFNLKYETKKESI